MNDCKDDEQAGCFCNDGSIRCTIETHFRKTKVTVNKSVVEKDIGNGFRGLFYILGPGAIYDLNLNIGYRF